MRKKRSVALTWVALTLLSVAARPCVAQDETPPKQFFRGMIVAAQRTYEKAEALHGGGQDTLADVLYAQSLDLLMEADRLEGGAYGIDFPELYANYFEDRVAASPALARQQTQIDEQIERTYQTASSTLTAQVHYMTEYMATHRKAFLENSFRRSLRYIPMIERVFAANGVDSDLAYMALVESGFRPNPTSHAGAQGLWQFMPATARQYGLRVDDGVDERNDPDKATVAAAKYLKYLTDKFGDPTLAVAAYNCGEGCVGRAMRKHDAKTFWDLVDANGLPRETLRYVPSIIAATIISRDPARYGIDYP